MASPSVRCFNCQYTNLSSFIASIRPAIRTVSTKRSTSSFQPCRRTFHTPTTYCQSRAVDTKVNTDVAPVPWYLRQQTAQSESTTIAERQQIPDTPADSPPILPQILQHISIDLGLDHLSLLDLRDLDPPPALGANLIMIVGSARSEKHLHVSADRLCRWLRSNYKLRPYADGLLGRNELKLKLKRKARRAKLLSSTTSLDSGEPDDGIRTGWICVNVGAVEAGNYHTKVATDTDPNQDFIGFGRGSEATRVVVQMMTEEKREELDLDGLWSSMLARQLKRKLHSYEEAKESDHNEEETKTDQPIPQLPVREEQNSFLPRKGRLTTIFVNDRTPPPAARQSTLSPKSQIMAELGISHLRSFHTTARTCSETRNTVSNSLDNVDPANLEPSLVHIHSPQVPEQRITQSLYFNTEQPHAPIKESNLIGKGLALRTQLKYLSGLSPAKALEILGEGEQDESSTEFLQIFHQNVPLFPETEHWECILELHSTAIFLGHKKYSRLTLLDKLRASQESGYHISEKCYWIIVKALILGPHYLHISKLGNRISRPLELHYALKRSLKFTFLVLKDMENLGHEILKDKLFILLHEAVSNPKFSTALMPNSEDLKQFQTQIRANPPDYTQSTGFHALRTDNQYRIRDLMDEFGYQPTSDQLILGLLQTYAEKRDWQSFFHIWNSIPAKRRRRTPAMYILMFTAIAQAGNQKLCQKALRIQVYEMKKEEPEVLIEGPVAEAVRACLLASDAQPDSAEWSELYKRCNGSLDVHANSQLH